MSYVLKSRSFIANQQTWIVGRAQIIGVHPMNDKLPKELNLVYRVDKDYGETTVIDIEVHAIGCGSEFKGGSLGIRESFITDEFVYFYGAWALPERLHQELKEMMEEEEADSHA